jgi:hypothetical protein
MSLNTTALSGAYELLTQAVKNTNITINLSAKQPTDVIAPAEQQPTASEEVKADVPEAGPSTDDATDAEPKGLVRADLVQLIGDLERVSTTLKRINKSIVGHEYTEVFFMLQNFDTILNSVKMVVNAV